MEGAACSLGVGRKEGQEGFHQNVTGDRGGEAQEPVGRDVFGDTG